MLREARGGMSFIFKERLEEDARAWNTDAARVDKDLFKAGAALLDAYALLPFILRATAWKSYNRTAVGVSADRKSTLCPESRALGIRAYTRRRREDARKLPGRPARQRAEKATFAITLTTLTNAMCLHNIHI